MEHPVLGDYEAAQSRVRNITQTIVFGLAAKIIYFCFFAQNP
jgi:hypothetical protein